MWSAPRGLSEGVGSMLDKLWGKLVEEVVKGAGSKWAKFPKRWILRGTSSEPYRVRPIEPCQ